MQWRLYIAFNSHTEIQELVNLGCPNVFYINISRSPASRFYEFDLLRKVYGEQTSDEVALIGVMSSKASVKLGITWRELIDVINKNVNQYDLLVFNPMYANNGLFLNGFEQGHLVGHTKFSYICSRLGLSVIFQKLGNPFCFSMCNYFLASRSILKSYFLFVDYWISRVDLLAGADSEFKDAYFGSADYWKNRDLNYDNFFVERLLELFLSTQVIKYFYFLPSLSVLEKKFSDRASTVSTLLNLKVLFHISGNRDESWMLHRLNVIQERQLFRALLLDDDPALI